MKSTNENGDKQAEELYFIWFDKMKSDSISIACHFHAIDYRDESHHRYPVMRAFDHP